MKITRMTLLALSDAMQRGDLTSREVTQAYLDRIHQVEGKVQAYISLNEEEALRQADECAAKNAENSLTDAPTREIHYINMRRQQRRILLQVTKDAQKVQGHPPQEAEVRALIGRIFAEYDRENDCTSLLSALHDLLAEMQHQPLPATRGEFEDRALLYVLLRRMEDFLLLKREFYETYGFEKNAN